MSFDVILPFLRPIEALLLDPRISEIMVNPDARIWIECEGTKTVVRDARFEPGALDAGLDVIANRFGKKLDADSPMLNLRLPDGSRLAAMIPPVVNPGPLLTIRKFTARDFRMEDLIAGGMLSEQQAAELSQRVRDGDNILIAGATNSGKTTLLGVLADAIPDGERILLIEDTAELHIRKPHVVSLEAQRDTHRSNVTFDDLLKSTLRHRPDRIIVGEVRGGEARTLLDAMNIGHRGTLATIHANGTRESLYRLASLAMRVGTSMGPDATEREVKRCLDLVVYVNRQDGKRLVEEILKVTTLGAG